MFVAVPLKTPISLLTVKSETGVKDLLLGQEAELQPKVDVGVVVAKSVAFDPHPVQLKFISKSSISATVGSTTCTSKPKPVTVVLAGMVF
jgi:hypothetical protein